MSSSTQSTEFEEHASFDRPSIAHSGTSLFQAWWLIDEDGVSVIFSKEAESKHPSTVTTSPQTKSSPIIWGDTGPTRVSYELEDSTTTIEFPTDIRAAVEGLFNSAREETFEDGVESEFSRGLVSIVWMYDKDAIEEITSLVVYEQVNPEVVSEALRWLGQIDHPPSHRFRRWLLERCLLCNSARTRDGAVLGLAFLDDAHAVPYLQRVIERETSEELRQDMQEVLSQLES